MTIKPTRLTLSLTVQVTLAAAVCGQNPTHWASYFGGMGNDAADQVVAAANGDILIAGTTNSTDLPVSPSAFQTSAGGREDVFVARLSADGSQVLAATYLGGNGRDMVYDLAEAGDGSIWVTGKSSSGNLPVTADSFAAPAGNTNYAAFVTQFDGNLTTVKYSTALGQTTNDEGRCVAIDDANQRVYIAGLTGSSTFPTTPTGFQSAVNSKAAFLAVLDRTVPGSTTLAYGTTLNGSSRESEVNGLSIDSAGVATLSGVTSSSDFPTTAGAIDATLGGSSDAFVARIDPNQSGGASLTYSTYIGGSGYADSTAHFEDAAGIVHLVLASDSQDLPVTANALLSAANVNLDIYYAQIDPAVAGAAGLRYGSWVIAGSGVDGQGVGNAAHNNCVDVAATPVGAVVWATSSSPAGVSTTPGAFQPATGVRRGHAMLLDLTGTDPAVSYATSYVGCSQNMFTGKVAVASNGDLLLTGWSDNMPATPAAAHRQPSGSMDGYVSRLAPVPWPSPARVLGTSCSGTAGTPAFTAVTPPRLCKSMVLQATGLPPSRPGAVAFGDGSSYLGSPLPISLARYGGGSCTLNAGPVIVLPNASNSSGTASVKFNVPLDLQLLSGPFAAQFLCTDPGANNLGVITTNGLELEVRW